MFNNCRQYNEEGSLIYEDANTLEKVLMDKVKELGPLPDRSKSTASTPTRNVGYVTVHLNVVTILVHFSFLYLFFFSSIYIQETEKSNTSSSAKIKNPIRYYKRLPRCKREAVVSDFHEITK